MSSGHGRAFSVALVFPAEPTVEAEGTSQLSVEEVRWTSESQVSSHLGRKGKPSSPYKPTRLKVSEVRTNSTVWPAGV